MTHWTVTAYGVGGTEFTYEVEAADGDAAVEEAFGRHGRRLRYGEVVEPLGLRAPRAVSSEFPETDPPGGGH